MVRKDLKFTKFENTLSVVEHMILTAPDEEIIADAKKIDGNGSDVRALINKRLELIRNGSNRLAIKDRLVESNQKASKNWGTGNWLAKLAVLQEMARINPRIAPHVGAMLSSGKNPTSEDVEKLTNELIQLGLLTKGRIDLE
jgi:hypothetical protein